MLSCVVTACAAALLQYTPLLPAVAVGTMEEGSIVEPVRKILAGKVLEACSTQQHALETAGVPMIRCIGTLQAII
jgi:hypothetical protein